MTEKIIERIKENGRYLKSLPTYHYAFTDMRVMLAALESDIESVNDLPVHIVDKIIENDVDMRNRIATYRTQKAEYRQELLMAIKNPGIIKYMKKYKEYLDDREFIEYIAQHDPINLVHIGPFMKDDKEIAQIAVNNYGLAISIFSDRIKKMSDIRMAAIMQNSHSIQYLDNLTLDEIFISISKCGVALKHLSDEQKNLSICSAAIEDNRHAILYVPKKYESDISNYDELLQEHLKLAKNDFGQIPSS